MDNAIAQDSAVSLGGGKGALFELGMIGAAVALPALCHLTGAPVTVLLPMHWPVIAAGLFCGWRVAPTALWWSRTKCPFTPTAPGCGCVVTLALHWCAVKALCVGAPPKSLVW